MTRILLLAGVCALVSTASFANCPAKAPAFRTDLDAADKRVNAAWLEKNLVGRRVKFSDGTETYKKDGSYSYKSGAQRWDASKYRFYKNGVRCIGYPNPRYDMYVVNSGRLVLINNAGDRFVGRLMK